MTTLEQPMRHSPTFDLVSDMPNAAYHLSHFQNPQPSLLQNRSRPVSPAFKPHNLIARWRFRSRRPTDQTFCDHKNSSLLFPVKSATSTGIKLPMVTPPCTLRPVSYTHLRAHETGRNLVCRLL